MKRVYKKIVNGALLLGSLLLCLLLAEVALAFLDLPKFYKQQVRPPQFQLIEDPAGAYYLNVPSSVIRFTYDGNPRGYFDVANGVENRINANGFRGNEFQTEKPSHVFRMAFLGDSFTFGEGVKFEDTYSEKVSTLLQQKYGKQSKVFESYNFGVGGYNTAQEVFLLNKVVLATHPDIIILGYTLNDAEPELFRLNPATREWERRAREEVISEGNADKLPPKSFLFRSRIAQWIWQLISKRGLAQQTERYYKQLYGPENPGWKVTQASLQALINLCESRRIHCYIVCFPLLFKLGPDYPFKDIHAMIRGEIWPESRRYVHFIDLFDRLEGKKDTDLWVHPTDQHPNELVHEIAAEALVDSISKTPGIFKMTGSGKN
jgi:hypothetical protein